MTDIAKLNALLSTPDQLTEISSQLVKRALIASIEQKLDLAPSDGAGLRIVEVGSPIPADLLGRVLADDAGVAASGWSDKGWTDIGIWERATWDKQGSPDSLNDVFTLPTDEREAILSRLNVDEMTALRNLGYIQQ